MITPRRRTSSAISIPGAASSQKNALLERIEEGGVAPDRDAGEPLYRLRFAEGAADLAERLLLNLPDPLAR